MEILSKVFSFQSAQAIWLGIIYLFTTLILSQLALDWIDRESQREQEQIIRSRH